MKLFGNKRDAAMLGKKAGAPGSGRAVSRRLTGLQRGLILLAVCLAVLTGTVVAVYKSFVRPVEIRQPVLPAADDTAEQTEEEEKFIPPTVIEIQTKLDEETGDEITVETEVPASHKADFYNILIAGTDDDGGRTDTIMIGRLDVKNHTVALLSIPRDTLISGSYSVPKINSVYGGAGQGEKGMEALKTKLAQTLGFEVDGYVLVKLDAFIQLVDLVGGVEFDVPMDMDYDDPTQDLHIHLKAGKQQLDGQQAMGLVRFRKGYATQDIMRTQVQQQFLQALAKKCLSVVTLTKIGELAEIFKENVLTDLSLGNIAYFGQELLKCDFDHMYSYTLEGEAVMVNGASCYAIYLNKTLQAVNEYFNPYDAEITAANVSIRTPDQVHAEQAAQAETEPEPETPEEPEEDPWSNEDPWAGEDPWEIGDPWQDPTPEDPWTEELPGDLWPVGP